MPNDFHNAVHNTPIGLTNTCCNLDDNFVLSRNSKEQHLKLVYDCLQKLDAENLLVDLLKYPFAKLKIEWLGYKLMPIGI